MEEWHSLHFFFYTEYTEKNKSSWIYCWTQTSKNTVWQQCFHFKSNFIIIITIGILKINKKQNLSITLNHIFANRTWYAWVKGNLTFCRKYGQRHKFAYIWLVTLKRCKSSHPFVTLFYILKKCFDYWTVNID